MPTTYPLQNKQLFVKYFISAMNYSRTLYLFQCGKYIGTVQSERTAARERNLHRHAVIQPLVLKFQRYMLCKYTVHENVLFKSGVE